MSSFESPKPGPLSPEQRVAELTALADAVLASLTPEPVVLGNGEILRRVSKAGDSAHRLPYSTGGPALSELTRPDGTRYFYLRHQDNVLWRGWRDDSSVVVTTDTWDVGGSNVRRAHGHLLEPSLIKDAPGAHNFITPDHEEYLQKLNGHAHEPIRRTAKEVIEGWWPNETTPAPSRFARATHAILSILGLRPKG
jgi:hypothetical protein